MSVAGIHEAVWALFEEAVIFNASKSLIRIQAGFDSQDSSVRNGHGGHSDRTAVTVITPTVARQRAPHKTPTLLRGWLLLGGEDGSFSNLYVTMFLEISQFKFQISKFV